MRRVVGHRRRHRLSETDNLGGRRRLNQLRRRGKNDRHRLRHLDLRRLRNVRQLYVGQFDLRRFNFDHRWRWDLELDLRWRRLLGFLDRNRLGQLGQLMPVVDRLLRRGADDDRAEGEQHIQRDGGEERTFALAAVVQDAKVCELHTLRCGIISAERLCHKKSLNGLVDGGGIWDRYWTLPGSVVRSAPKSAVLNLVLSDRQLVPLSDPTTK